MYRRTPLKHILYLTLFILCLSSGIAQGEVVSPQEKFISMDSKVQSLKSRALALGREIATLEEELLFPASTQVAVYLSANVDSTFKLISAQLKLDDKIIANHLYTVSEQDALMAGGIQQIYLGNTTTGSHKLNMTYMGKIDKKMSRYSIDYKFEKGMDPVYLEMKVTAKELTGGGKKAPKFSVKKWE
jgi:hypothetical protein